MVVESGFCGMCRVGGNDLGVRSSVMVVDSRSCG